MKNFIKLLLLAAGMSVMFHYPMGNLLIILPSNILLSPLNYLQFLGLDAAFTLGLLISCLILYMFNIQQRYTWSLGFISLFIGIIFYTLAQSFKLEISIYSLEHVKEYGFNFKYLIELVFFIFISIGFILIYKSNLPAKLTGKKA